jgi:predicted DNA-binding protein
MSKRKSKMGRPKYPPGAAMSVYVAFRLTPAERVRMEAAAGKQGQTMAAFLRDAVLGAVDQVEGKA